MRKYVAQVDTPILRSSSENESMENFPAPKKAMAREAMARPKSRTPVLVIPIDAAIMKRCNPNKRATILV